MASSSLSSTWLERVFFFSRAKKSSEEENKKEEKEVDPALLLRYGVTEQLQELLKSFTADNFKDFNLQPDDQRVVHDSPMSTSTKHNVQQDLTEWQEQHAMFVLSTVKELSQLRYVLCPRYLKERQFWRIYFALVNSYVAPYEMHATQEAKLKTAAMENEESERNACEVEMTDANHLWVAREDDSDSPLLVRGRSVETGDEAAKVGESDEDNLRRQH